MCVSGYWVECVLFAYVCVRLRGRVFVRLYSCVYIDGVFKDLWVCLRDRMFGCLCCGVGLCVCTSAGSCACVFACLWVCRLVFLFVYLFV